MERAFDLCVRKTHGNIKRLADEPKSAAWAEDGNYFAFPEGFEIGNWTSSFFTGMALIVWQETEDESFSSKPPPRARISRESLRAFPRHAPRRRFLLALYSIALHKLTGDKQHRETGTAAAAALYQRFNQKGGFIRATGAAPTNQRDRLPKASCERTTWPSLTA